MLYEPLIDSKGNKLMVVRQLPGMGLEVTVSPATPGVASFNADAAALRALAETFASAAEAAERAAERAQA
jgi:hypothetical protein